MMIGLVIVVTSVNQNHVSVMSQKKNERIYQGRFKVATKDSRFYLMLQLYPKTWHKHIKEAYALGYDDAIDTLWENMPELTLGEIQV
jgi:hypothetical protein